ncbi:MAG: hypothetical protein LBL00_00845 [Endomicrobium sp.]|jgi:hypothetical protein|nr:hypothetical protein [Endomicrobium sp.]
MKLNDFFKSESANKDGGKPWQPTYRWAGITASIILAVLIIAFFVLNIVLKPYMRERPLDITPWLDKSKKETKAELPKQNIEQDKQNGAV